MRKGRLEAFSDGVIAIIITIMVLELRMPAGAALSDLKPLLPVFISYILSFINVGLYWNNHHHLFSLVEHVNGRVLWANMFLLFWLSLTPFTTAWMGENHFSLWPIILYGVVLLMCGVAYFILTQSLLRLHGKDAALSRALGKKGKENISVVIYLVALPMAFVNTYITLALYVSVACIWLIPDRRIEKNISDADENL